MQYSAFKEGYSFNTLEEGGNDIRDSLRIRRNGDNIRIVSGKTTATVGTNGAKVCMVRPQLPSPSLRPQNMVCKACMQNCCFPAWCWGGVAGCQSLALIWWKIMGSTVQRFDAGALLLAILNLP